MNIPLLRWLPLVVARAPVTVHTKLLLAFLAARVGSRDVAEEILQAAFVRAVEKGGSIREAESAVAIGLAMPLPAMSGAEPCVACDIASRSPTHRPGASPSPPTTIKSPTMTTTRPPPMMTTPETTTIQPATMTIQSATTMTTMTMMMMTTTMTMMMTMAKARVMTMGKEKTDGKS